jgi:hypothetical protein
MVIEKSVYDISAGHNYLRSFSSRPPKADRDSEVNSFSKRI